MFGSVLCALLCSALLSIAITLQGCGGGHSPAPSPPSGGNGLIVPQVLRDFYKLPKVAAADSTEALASEKTTQAVFASLQQHWSPSDRAAFQKKFDLPDRNVTELDSGNMASDSYCEINPDGCGEANLDVQYMLAMSPWSHMGFYYTESSFTEWIEAVSNLESPPDVFSISYGEPECGAHSDLRNTFNNLAMKLGTRGVTIVASSGDDGAQGTIARQEECGWDNLGACNGLQVNWPASSPYVTAVGGTMGVESGSEEVTCQVSCKSAPEDNSCDQVIDELTLRPKGAMITSGGGYSAQETPAYQKDQVKRSGRGVPDVSLAAHNYLVYVGGQEVGVDGTSASAPAFGGMISQVNARRIAANKPTLGFINQVIYSSPSAFNDITSGDNKCGTCSEGVCKCCGGYEATSGWDPVTGLGSVNFEKFEALFDIPTGQTTQPLTSRKHVRNTTKSTSLLKAAPHRLGWKKMERVPPDTLHKVLFAVKERNIDQLEELFLDRSNPKSPNYGKWLTGEEVRQMTFNEEAVQTVRQSLVKAGAQSLRTSLGGEIVSAVAPVRVWEQLLQCQFHLHEQSGHKGTHIAADAYSLPSDLRDHLQGALRVLEVTSVIDHSTTPVKPAGHQVIV